RLGISQTVSLTSKPCGSPWQSRAALHCSRGITRPTRSSRGTMSSDETPNVPAARNTRDAVREKAQLVHAQQSRARIMRRVIIGFVAAVAVGSIGTAVALAVGSSISKPVLSPSGMTHDGVMVTEVSPGAASVGTSATPTPEPSGAAATPTPTPTESAAEPTAIHIY